MKRSASISPGIAARVPAFGLLGLLSLFSLAGSYAATTIDRINRYAWGANIGWIDWYADGTNGAVINDYYCSGYLYGANVGWMNLGSGSPADGIRYQNGSASDYGVNNDGLGNLRGYAWGANIGWINFEATGGPKVDIRTGQFSGYAWSANCGWISLSNAVAVVQTDHLLQGPLAANGLPIPWLLANFGTTAVDPNADPDGDGASNAQEYWSDTDPNNAGDYLHITSESFGPGGITAALTWSSELTRNYFIETAQSLNGPFSWADSGLGVITPDGASTARTFSGSAAPMRFYRITAVRPLP